jgi:hypothetical protein
LKTIFTCFCSHVLYSNIRLSCRTFFFKYINFSKEENILLLNYWIIY